MESAIKSYHFSLRSANFVTLEMKLRLINLKYQAKPCNYYTNILQKLYRKGFPFRKMFLSALKMNIVNVQQIS